MPEFGFPQDNATEHTRAAIKPSSSQAAINPARLVSKSPLAYLLGAAVKDNAIQNWPVPWAWTVSS